MTQGATKQGIRIVIIGAGPGGLCAAIQLRQAGFDNVVVLEQAAGLGGTWWHNRYPGCQCDVPSILYSYSFTPDFQWSTRYARQPEIQAYLAMCAERFGVADRIRLNARVVGARWNDDSAVWEISLAGGEQIACEVVISAVGLFNEPAIPDIPGLAGFAGAVMHTARWDPNVDLAGRNIGVIGSAASAVQLVPEIAPQVARLDVYQRTPNYVRPREPDYTAEEQASLHAHPAAIAQERAALADWINRVVKFDDAALLNQMRDECIANARVVIDPELRARLSPDYPFGSKRGLVSSDWFPTFNRSNVALVTEPIERIEAAAVVTKDGARRPADCLILATGFETSRFLSVIDVTGRDGVQLGKEWAEGARAYLGLTMPRFPNLFLLYGPNTNSGSVISQLEMQVAYVVRHLHRMVEENLAWIEIGEDAAAAFDAKVQGDLARLNVLHNGVSGYYRAPSGRIVTQSPYDMAEYEAMTTAPDFTLYRKG